MMNLNLKKSLLSGQGPIELNVSLEIPKGQLLALSGPSGSGKTSLLRIVAGLLQPESGRIEVNGQCWLDTKKGINWPPQKRNIGFVFQDYALFPHFSVGQNLNFALAKGQPRTQIQDLISVMELEQLLDRKPSTLSGGQQQRVALARALVRRPSLLLLDEPLSALDPGMRHRLQAYILQVHQTFNLTTILVSHDQKEIARMADRALLIKNGLIMTGNSGAFTPNPPSEASLRLTGRIASLQRSGTHYQLKVVVDNKVLDLSVPVSIGRLDQGEEVLLETNHWNLRKFK